MQTCFPCSAEKDNCSFLIFNSSFPQGRINPPIRGSIVKVGYANADTPMGQLRSQSPYKGFNSMVTVEKIKEREVRYQSPYKGFNRTR